MAKYSYQKPIPGGDGWETASLTEVGIDPKPISDLVQGLIDTPISDVAAPYPQPLLIARHGKLVLRFAHDDAAKRAIATQHLLTMTSPMAHAGNGGQMVIVVPDLDLVVAFTGGNYNQGRVWWRWNDDLVPNVLIPAVDRH